MTLTSRELIELADKRLAEVQQRMHPVEIPSSVVYHGQHESELGATLEAMQLYVDQYLADNSFPWEVHWARHLVDEDCFARPDFKSLAASRRDIDAFIQRHTAIAKSVDGQRRGTLEQLQSSVLLHVSVLLKKLLRPHKTMAAALSSLKSPVKEPAAMDSLNPPSHQEQEKPLMSPSPAPVASASSEIPIGVIDPDAAVAVASPQTVTTAPKPPPPRSLRSLATEGKRPWTARNATAHNKTPDALRTVIDGVEYISVNMKVANNICRPNSARQLNPQKKQEPRVAAMVEALERNAGAVNARDGPILAAPNTVSRWRTESMLSTSPPSTPLDVDAAEGVDPNAKVLSTVKPSIRKTTHAAAQAHHIALAQVPVSGVVQASPRVSTVATNQWGVRDRVVKADAKHSRWILATHQANHDGHSDVARHTQTVAVTSAITAKPSVARAHEREAHDVKGSWGPHHDTKWVAPKWSDKYDSSFATTPM